MLIATPGQTTSYPLLSGATTNKTCHPTSGTPKNSINNSIPLLNNKPPPQSSNGTASSTANALLKTLSVRLNRGTELLKNTVQKALISSSSISNTIVNANSSLTATISAAATSTSTKSTMPSKALQKMYTVPPTFLHRYSEERLDASSTDSLFKDMCHFKPIRSQPITPSKCSSKSRAPSLKFPRACLATSDNLNLTCDGDNIAGFAGEDCEYNSFDFPQPKPSAIMKVSRKSAFIWLNGKTDRPYKYKSAAKGRAKSTDRTRKNSSVSNADDIDASPNPKRKAGTGVSRPNSKQRLNSAKQRARSDGNFKKPAPKGGRGRGAASSASRARVCSAASDASTTRSRKDGSGSGKVKSGKISRRAITRTSNRLSPPLTRARRRQQENGEEDVLLMKVN